MHAFSAKLQENSPVFDVSSQIQTDMYVPELRAYEPEIMLTFNN